MKNMEFDDGWFRVVADAGDDGVICCEFPEALHLAGVRASAKRGKIGRGQSEALRRPRSR